MAYIDPLARMSDSADSASWVIPGDFDPDKLSIQPAARSQGDTYERGKLVYEYAPGAPKKGLLVTVPRTPDAYLVCRGVGKDTFTRGDTRVDTNRYGAHLVLNGSNNHHAALYKLFQDVVLKVEEITGASVIFPNKDMEGYSILYTNLIHSNDGVMYSKAYTDDTHLDILDCGKCLVRPALLLSTLKRSATETKIRVQISHMYVHQNIASFPLATSD